MRQARVMTTVACGVALVLLAGAGAAGAANAGSLGRSVGGGSIRVANQTVPESYDQDFEFVFDAQGAPSTPFTLNGDPASGNGAQRAFEGLPEGQYVVSVPQDVPGWALSSGDLMCDNYFWTPTDDGRAVIIDLPEDGVISCSFTQYASSGSLSLTKNVVGSDSDEWAFDVELVSAGGEVDVRTATEAAPTVDWMDLVPGAVYTLREAGEPSQEWVRGEVTCQNLTDEDTAKPGFQLVAAPGREDTCAVENTRAGSIVVAKSVTGGDGMFDFTGDWHGAGDFSITTEDGLGTATFHDVVPGSYTVQEIARDGFENTDLICVDGDPDGTRSGASDGVGAIALDPGETVVCTFTNAPWGTLVVDKVTVPAGASQDFSLAWAPEGGEPTHFTLTDAAEPFTPGPLAPGTYTVTETPTPGWTLADLGCVGSSGSTTVDGATATVDVLSGETVLCTFTNERPSALDVAKSVVAGPDTVEPGVFRIAYEVVVSNTATVARTYDLVDRLAFGGGIVVRDASVTSLDGLAVTGDWDGVDQPTVTSGATLAAGAEHRYRVTVVAQAPADVVPHALACDPAGTAPGGFLNTARVLGQGGQVEAEASACASPEGAGPGGTPPASDGPDGSGGGAANGGAGTSGSWLRATGANMGAFAAIAGVFVLVGAAGVYVRSRRS